MHRTLILCLGLAACPTENDDTGPICIDNDGDGFTDCDDCNDEDPDTYPGATEKCDGVDNNCDGETVYEEEDGEQCRTCDAQGLFYLTQLQVGLSEAIQEASDGVDCSYSGATRYMFTALDKSGGEVECVYTGRKVTVGSDKPDPEDMNTEHTWPQSQGAQSIPAKCDLHHLFPTDSDANQIRADLPLRDVVSDVDWSEGGSRRGLSSDGSLVFEPRDEHKGEAARALLYFANRYGHTLSDQALETYHNWHTSDPALETDLIRTEDIARRQGNPNPFVFCPILVDRLADNAP